MPLEMDKVAAVIAKGLNTVCATCENYWKAHDLGLSKCLAKDGCGGPMSGGDFHEYKGPMNQFDQFCFVCGNKPTHAIRVSNSVRVIGCCSEHVEMVKRLKPEGRDSPRMVLISKDGDERVDENSPAPKQVLKFRSS